MRSATRYYFNNRGRFFTITGILAISVFCISFVVTLVNSVYTTAKIANTSLFTHCSLVTYKGNDNSQESTVIRALSDAGDVFHIGILYTSLKTVFGTTSSYVLLGDSTADLQSIVADAGIAIDPAVVTSMQEGQVITHEDILTNLKESVGGMMGQYQIVGSFTGDALFSVGLISVDQLSQLDFNGVTYIVFPRDGTVANLNAGLGSLPSMAWTVTSVQTQTQALDDDFSSMNQILTLIIVMVSVCLAIAVAAFVYTMYASRYDEFAILNALGYTKGYIRVLILKETLLVLSVSWVIGYGLSLAGLAVAGHAIYSGIGGNMQIYSLKGMLYTLLIPALVLAFAIVPTSRTLGRSDLVSVIERRG